jgi:apolipoprotein N-acyltransferase
MPVVPEVPLAPPLPRTRPSLRDAALVLLAGYAHAASLAWPFKAALIGLPAYGEPVWGLQLAALALLAWRLNGAGTARAGGWLGWLFATAMLVGTFWWLFISLHTYGGLPAALTVLAVLALALGLGLYYAFASAAYVALAPKSAWARALVFASLWLLAELARVRLFTGFPWGEGGYAHIDGWAQPLAAYIGVHGLTFVAAAVAALLASCAAARRQVGLPALGLLAGVAASWVVAVLPPASADAPLSRPALQVTLLQGNIAQEEKFQGNTGVADALNFYGQQLMEARTDLVVLPETAIPLLPSQLDATYWTTLKNRFAVGDQAALIGLPLGSFTDGYTNSVLGLKPGAEAYRYDKHHLVPFGEFIPPFFKWFIRLMNIPLGDFNRGDVGQASFEWRGERLAPNICYEDLFGEELGARFADPARAPTMFVNVSNIGWFGNSIAIDQHLHISRMRALEFARPMLRATNTGATVVIDHAGRVTASLERHTRGALLAEVRGVDAMTFYARWVAKWGLLPWLVLCVGVVAGALLKARMRPAGTGQGGVTAR